MMSKEKRTEVVGEIATVLTLLNKMPQTEWDESLGMKLIAIRNLCKEASLHLSVRSSNEVSDS